MLINIINLISISLLNCSMNNIYKLYIKYNDNLIKFKTFKYWNLVLIGIWVILFMCGLLKISRIKYFVIICLIIFLYKIMWNLIKIIIKKYLNLKSDYLLNLLIKVSQKTNIILYIITCIEPLLYNIKIKNEKLKVFLIKSILGLLIPFKLLIYYIYFIINNIKKYSFYELIWKRVYGTILSVLIFTNIIQIIFDICKTWLNMFILLYLILFIISYENRKEYKVYKLDYTYEKRWLNILYKDVYEIWKLKASANILCYYIKYIWEKKSTIEKFNFLCEYGNNLNIEWFKILKINSYKKWETKIKIQILNSVTDVCNFNFEMEYWFWFYNIWEDLYRVHYIINELLEYKSHLEYTKLLYEKYNFNNLKIYQEHNINELLKYNEIMLRAYLYYFWDVKGIIELKIDSDYGLQLLYVKSEDNIDSSIKWNKKKENYVNKLQYMYIKLGNQNYQKFYEISLFTDSNVDEGEINVNALGYIQDIKKYKKYIKFYNWQNNSIKFIDENGNIHQEKDWDIDVLDFINSFYFPAAIEIKEEWCNVLQIKKQELINSYNKGVYLKYLEKL